MKQDAILTGAVFAVLMALFVYAANDWRLPWVPERPTDVEWCSAHEVAQADCVECDPARARGGTQVVQLRQPEENECPNICVRINLAKGVPDRIGLKLVTLELRNVSERLEANAETRYPPGKFARVAPRISGVIREVAAVIGQEVEKGDVLAVLDSPEFGRAKGDYLQALALLKVRQKTYESEKSLYPKITTIRQMLEAEAAHEEAKLTVERSQQKLATLGLSRDQIAAVKEKRDASPRMEVTAPFAGVVVNTTAVPGEMGGPDRPIFGVADTGRLWLLIDVYEIDLARIEQGQRVFFFVAGIPGKRFPGKVVAIGNEIDDRTRTAKVYADVKNVQGLLKINQFGRAQIRITPPEEKLLLPKEAVQNDGDCDLAFVSPTTGTYLPRKIEIGTVYEGGYEVVGGLAAGEKVVTTGSFLLKTEILRGQIGAG